MAKEVTKNTAMKIYNLYCEIETSEKIIIELEELIQKWNEGGKPPVITDNYKPYGSIELCIPYFEKGQFKRVLNISYPAAIKVLKSHICCLKHTLKKEIEDIQ